MLELKNITKDYPAGSGAVHALRGIDLQFRHSEFVSILGPSGCGKTTMLNILGGLDRYTDGDLVIDGVSTKKYKDRNWDSYRNHTIGFVFQSYNLIPHQSVLQNVELALSLSGVGRAERKRRAKQALADVGLENEIRKKPSELSGGQMQRVAIARALVNNPSIILADEPTGALDTETSVQVMEILKKIASDRLVIMVTHNPDLAEQYSTRIIRMLDGKVISDTAPLSDSEVAAEKQLEAQSAENSRRKKLPSMSYSTSFGLSMKNLFTKKGRTLLTAFAGSIGIIGIALIYAVSHGMSSYIDLVQEDTLSTYPLTIQSETADMTALLTAFAAARGKNNDIPQGVVVEQQFMQQVFMQIGTNDIAAFKDYLEEHMDEVKEDINVLQYSYDVSPQIYSLDFSYGINKLNPSSAFSGIGAMGSGISMMGGTFQQMLDNEELVKSQVQIVAGRWPENYNEVLLVLEKENSISDFLAYSIGLRDPKELSNMMNAVLNGEQATATSDPLRMTYDDLLSLSFSLVPASGRYRYNASYDVWEDMSDDTEYMKQLIESGEKLNVVGIVCPREGASAVSLNQGVAYLPELTYHVIDIAKSQPIVQKQLANREVDVFTGKTFTELEEQGGAGKLNFNDMITVDSKKFSEAIGMNVSEDYLQTLIEGYMSRISASITVDTTPANAALTKAIDDLCVGVLKDYVANSADPSTGFAVIDAADAATIAESYLSGAGASVLASLEENYVVPAAAFKQIYSPVVSGCVTAAAGIPLDDATSETVAAGYAAGVKNDGMTKMMLGTLASKMTEAVMQKKILSEVGTMSGDLIKSVAGSFNVDGDKIASAFNFNLDEDELTRLMSAYSGGKSEQSADANLRGLGYADIENPRSISVYLVDFAAKEHFISFIDDYNRSMEQQDKDDMVISYSDIAGVLMSSVKTIIDSIGYVLIAFVAISLVVSSIMIAVITLISVQERTKEIGILRALGASKRNVSGMFNAETVMIGFCSGVLGIGLSYLLCIPINKIIYRLSGLPELKARLPLKTSIVLICISVILTLFAGIIPSRSAAKKEPVVALRTE